MFDLDIPIPRKTGRPIIYHFDKMPVGASFAIPCPTSADKAAASWQRTHPGWKYVSRTLTENGVRVVRIWRTA